MIKYIKNFFQDFYKKSYKFKVGVLFFVLLYISILAICFIKVDYEMITPGAINPTSSSVKVDNDKGVGNIFTVGVYTQQKISLFKKWLVSSNDYMDLVDFNENVDLNSDDYYQYAKKMKDLSITNAIIVAYEEASKINNEVVLVKDYHGLLVTAKLPYANGQVQPDDIIIKVNDQEINNYETYSTIIKNIKNDDEYKMTVIRDLGQDNEREVVVTHKKGYNSLENRYLTGIAVEEYYTIDNDKTYPKFNINKNQSSIGSSGGAMLALSIYNSLLDTDITKGRVIVGTGAITINGEIEVIGGVQQKIVTASKYSIDIFFVPEDIANYPNYTDALEMYNKLFKGKTPTFELVSVKDFSDIITYLNSLELEKDK